MRTRRVRAGASTLEIQVALAVLGIALAGLCPAIMSQMKLLRKIEAEPAGPDGLITIRGRRVVDGDPVIPEGRGTAPPYAHLRAHPDPRVRRLQVAATITIVDPGLEAAQNLPEAIPDLPTTPTEKLLGKIEATLVGEWEERASGGPPPSNYSILGPGEPGDFASWTFDGIASAYYRVLLSWPGSEPIPDDISDVVTIDGQGPGPGPIPPRFAPDGGRWLDLGNRRLGPGSTLRLGRSRLGAVVADAVKIGPRNRTTIPPPLDAGSDAGFSARVLVEPLPP